MKLAKGLSINYVYNIFTRAPFALESGGSMKTLDTQIQAWLKTSQRHQDALDIATFTHRRNSRRVKAARESLEEAKAELYGEGSINGRNKEERDAMLYRLTINERLEALEESTFALERARADIARDRQERYALQMLVALAIQVPLVPTEARSTPQAETALTTLPLFDDMPRAG
jgi:hypothetical protein